MYLNNLEDSWINKTHESIKNIRRMLDSTAELIIQECYQICKDNAMSVEDQKDLTYNDGVFDCALMIKDHFGLLKD